MIWWYQELIIWSLLLHQSPSAQNLPQMMVSKYNTTCYSMYLILLHITDGMKNIESDEETCEYENSTSQANTVPQQDSPVFNNECLQDNSSPPLDQQVEEENAPTTEHVITAKDSEDGQLDDQQVEPEVVSSKSGPKEQDIEGTCSSQSAPQLERQDSQQSAATCLECQDSSEQSPTTHVEHEDSQQLTEQLKNPECTFQVGEESSEAAQELAAVEGEEIQESQSDKELNQELKKENYRETVDDHTAHSEGYQEEPSRAESLEVRMDSVEETETKEGMYYIR